MPVTVRFPGSDQVFNTGLGSVAVPGTLRGLLHVQRRLGRLPLAEVVAPAAGLAREGLRLETRQAYFLELLRPIMTLTPAGRALFEPRGSYLSQGDRFANPELADLLESLPNGGDREFYEGSLASRIDRDMHEGRGLLTEADLAAYRVIERQPLVARYRGVPLLTNPPPSLGGSLLVLSLRLLEASDARSLGFGSSDHLSLLTSVMIEVDRCRAAGHLGPDPLPESVLHRSLERVRGSSGGTTHVSTAPETQPA
jgi:gamma-glutamyltranspeptidase/glutathione hydrolase